MGRKYDSLLKIPFSFIMDSVCHVSQCRRDGNKTQGPMTNECCRSSRGKGISPTAKYSLLKLMPIRLLWQHDNTREGTLVSTTVPGPDECPMPNRQPLTSGVYLEHDEGYVTQITNPTCSVKRVPRIHRPTVSAQTIHAQIV